MLYGGDLQMNPTMNSTSTPSPFLLTPNAMTAPSADAWPPADGLALQTAYTPDPFQQHAIVGIHRGDHVFVTAKTGSGKTFVGEYLIAYMLAKGKRVFYTTPIKSLSNQKYHDLKKLFPQTSVGILTGDIKMEPDAQIIVMTAEILRNLFYKRGTVTEQVGTTAAVSLEGVGGVVMDEVHYIQDPDRGHVWEESLILCPRDLQLVLLSATMPSAASLAGWLADLHQRHVWLLSTTYRIVPLTHGILRRQADGSHKMAVAMDAKNVWHADAYGEWLQERQIAEDAAADHKKAVAARKADGYNAPVVKRKVHHEEPGQKLKRTIEWLQENTGLPALFFVFSRKSCEYYADKVEGSMLEPQEGQEAERIINFHLSRHRATLEKSPQYHKIKDLLIRGVAFHHSGLLPLLKEIVEILFTRGFVKVLFATETFSVGLNMPTKTVVFLELRKFTDDGVKRLLRPDEYIQMAGRAGRRGIDTQGIVLYEPLKDPVSIHEYQSLLTGALPPLESRMRFHYDFILKHYLTNGSVPIAEQSYWAQQKRKDREHLGAEVAALEEQYQAILGRQGQEYHSYVEELQDLVQKTEQGSNNARKKADLALRRWKEEHSGGRWDVIANTHKQIIGLHERVQSMKSQVKAWDTAPLLDIAPMENCLRTWGFLDTENRLTTVGTTATEVNEGHNILMPLLAEHPGMASLSGQEIACILATFLREGGGKEEAMPSLDDIEGLGRPALDILEWLTQEAEQKVKDENQSRCASGLEFWTLSPLWTCIVIRWLEGGSLHDIATEFSIFEGNVQRGLLKVANLLEEWGAIATLRKDLGTLEKLANLRFLRDDIVVDSLYLRM